VDQELAKLILNSNGEFTKEEIRLFTEIAQVRHLDRGDTLLECDDICSSIFFLIKGAAIQYLTNENADIEILDLYTKGDVILNHKSFTTRSKSTTTIQSFAEATVVELTIDAIHALIAKSQSFLQMGKALDRASLKQDVLSNYKSPDARYQYILESSPEWLQLFPLKYIASFLDVTPETLSRVRHRIQKD